MKKKRIIVGLSGGVDSSVTAKILLDQGHEVIGVFMKNWDDKDDAHCPAAIDAIDARNVANHLGIPFYTFNFAKEYWDDVFDYFLEQHKLFRTPNPDILCNKYIKFKQFLEAAEKLGADFIATGHYARNFFDKETQLFELQVPEDANKDQTYFLHTLGQKQLAKTLFPLSEIPKPKIREMALDAGFANAKKKDSTGICFVGERDYMEFLKKYLHQEKGNIVTEGGQVIGEHIGLSFYTLGQRKNLNIGGVKGHKEAPWFVLEKNVEKNELIACQDDENPRLFESELTAEKLHWVSGFSPFFQSPGLDIRGKKAKPGLKEKNFKCTAKIRYRQNFQDCTISPLAGETKRGIEKSHTPSSSSLPGKRFKVEFKEPQRAITPGQSIVFYDRDKKICLGGGEIV